MKSNFPYTLIFLFFISIFETNAQQTVGLFEQDPGSLPGYVLFAPSASDSTYLIDKCGKRIHEWVSDYHPGLSVYLLPDGNLLRCGNIGNSTFNAGGTGGIVEKFDWNSNLLWWYSISSNTQCQHHDAIQLPNGNIVAIVWDLKTNAEAIAAGRNPSTLNNTLWSEKLIEYQPSGSNQATIVWEWHLWDHLIQDYNAALPNYGVVADYPELVDLNFSMSTGGPIQSDWIHINGLDYNEELDQILVSSRHFSEVWIIDHSTTTAEAASHSGGNSGKGGDLLYRWGNPQAYNRGTSVNQQLFGQHNPSWIDTGFPDEGKIMVFNNGEGRPAGDFSTVDIIDPPLDAFGNYSINATDAYLPLAAYWSYQAPDPFDFFSSHIGGARRLSNGNTMIAEGTSGNFFEVDASDTTVWRYISPIGQFGIISQGNNAGMNSAFRCTLYEPEYPGFNGQTLIAGGPIELNPLPYECNMITGIPLAESSQDFSMLVTNPFADYLSVVAGKDFFDATIVLTDASGKMMADWNGVNIQQDQPFQLSIDSDVPSGFYLLTVWNSEEKFSLKLIHL